MSGLGNLWRESAAESFGAPPLIGAAEADLIIIGGGFTGLSAALTGAGQGARTVLLEAETVGHGGWSMPGSGCRPMRSATRWGQRRVNT